MAPVLDTIIRSVKAFAWLALFFSCYYFYAYIVCICFVINSSVECVFYTSYSFPILWMSTWIFVKSSNPWESLSAIRCEQKICFASIWIQNRKHSDSAHGLEDCTIQLYRHWQKPGSHAFNFHIFVTQWLCDVVLSVLLAVINNTFVKSYGGRTFEMMSLCSEPFFMPEIQSEPSVHLDLEYGTICQRTSQTAGLLIGPLRQPDFLCSGFRLLLRTFSFGQWDQSTVWISAPSL